MRKITDSLWIGNAFEARDMRQIHNAGIRVVVDLAADERPIQTTRDLISIRVPLVDGGGNSELHLNLAVITVRELIDSATPTLVACSAGMSRSPAICASALAIRDQVTLPEAVNIVVAGSASDIAPPLLADLRSIVTRHLRKPS